MRLDTDLRDVRTAGLPVLAGVVNGVLAYVAAFLGTFVLFTLLGIRPFFELSFAGSASLPSIEGSIGFVFYGGHLVSTAAGGESFNFALHFAQFGPLYVALVALVLAGTGYYLGGADGIDTPRAGFLAGALVAFGYLPLAAIGSALVTYSPPPEVVGESGAGTLSIPLVQAVLVAGIALPVVLGGVGGAVAASRS